MTDAKSRLLKIRDWNDLYEVSQSRKPMVMKWVPMTNRMGEDGFVEMMMHPKGAAFFGAWNALIFLAAGCSPRGSLIRSNGNPHTVESINRLTRFPLDILRDAIPFFIHEIGWMEEVEFSAQTTTQQPTAEKKPNGTAPHLMTPFDDAWSLWTAATQQATDRDGAMRAFEKSVPKESLDAFNVCLKDYVLSDRVKRGIGISDFRNWITKQAKDKFEGRWARARKTTAEKVDENLKEMHQ